MNVKCTIFIIFLLLSATGCTRSLFVKIIEPSDGNLLKEYLRQGEEHESRDEPSLALEAYTLAMTVEPSNRKAVQGRKRTEMVLRELAEKHYRMGLKLYREGQYGRGRYQLLIALRYRPSHSKSVKLLTTRKRIQIKRYVLHRIKAGETLSKIAKAYYGDQNQFSTIAQYNNLMDASRLLIGQEIKIPEVEGMTFLADKDTISIENQELTNQPFPISYEPWQTFIVSPNKEKRAETDRIEAYREQGMALFNKYKYQEAIAEFSKVLYIAPDDQDSREYIHKSHYQLALSLYENEDYLAAREQFEASLRYQADCAKCNEYMQKSEEVYKESHYKKGMQYYENEQLIEAIQEWEMVITLDPDYKNADYLINKAKVILSRFEEIKRGQKGKP